MCHRGTEITCGYQSLCAAVFGDFQARYNFLGERNISDVSFSVVDCQTINFFSPVVADHAHGQEGCNAAPIRGRGASGHHCEVPWTGDAEGGLSSTAMDNAGEERNGWGAAGLVPRGFNVANRYVFYEKAGNSLEEYVAFLRVDLLYMPRFYF